jgi:drug/metabolite transporter (DMT)-like permease
MRINNLRIYTKLFLTAVFWGGTFIAGRVVAREVGPFSASFLRFGVASVCLLLLTYSKAKGLPVPKKNQIVPLLLLGMTGIFAYNVFFFKGLHTIQAGRAALIIANNPVIIALLAAWFFKEKLTAGNLAGIILSLSGALVVISKGDVAHIVSRGLGLGEFYVFCCVLSWVAYSLLGKVILVGLSPLVSVSYSCVVGAACLFIPACGEGMLGNLTNYSRMEWLSILYLGIFGTVLGFVWYYEGIKEIGPTKASQFINFVPISAIVLAFLILREPVTASLFIGTILVCSGVYLTNKVKRREACLMANGKNEP